MVELAAAAHSDHFGVRGQAERGGRMRHNLCGCSNRCGRRRRPPLLEKIESHTAADACSNGGACARRGVADLRASLDKTQRLWLRTIAYAPTRKEETRAAGDPPAEETGGGEGACATVATRVL